MNQQLPNIALIGNPNCGKTTVFNALTRLKQKISNLPGTTVDKKTGTASFNNTTYNIIDLPGVYSLQRTDTEQAIVLTELKELKKKNTTLLCIADESNLRRNLLLVQQVLQLGMPAALVLNMHDIALRHHVQVDEQKLSNILGIPVISIIASKRIGFDQLHAAISQAKTSNWGQQASQSIETKYQLIEEVLQQVQENAKEKRKSLTAIIDKIATHKIGGFILLFLVLSTVFQLVFTVAAYPMEWIEQGMQWLSHSLMPYLPGNLLPGLICNGLLPGITGILVFLPQIALLFLLIGILEDSGYLTRVSYISDYPMRKIGLNGRSVIPLLGGFACAIPAIMSTRTIANRYERLLTMFVIPLMACSARLPVYVLIIGLCIPNTTVAGIINLQGLVMTTMYLSGIILSSAVALAVRLFKKNKQGSEFILELPTYQIPQLRNLWNNVWERCKSFINEAGKIILIISMVLWFAANYGPQAAMQSIPAQVQQQTKQYTLNSTQQQSLQAKLKLENSYLGHIGKFIQPAIQPLGFDWKTGIAILSSFAAREVFVGTMGTIFNLTDTENIGSLHQQMSKSKNSARPSGKYDLAYGVSMLVFYAVAMQCASTVSVMFKESKSLKLTLLQLFGYSGMAYFLAWIVQIILG